MIKRLLRIFEIDLDETAHQTGAPPFRESKQVFETDDAFVSADFKTFVQCKHGHAIHGYPELGGRCMVCREYLCKECATLRCEIDGDLICFKDARTFGERIICVRHGFFERLFLPPVKLGDGKK